VWVCERGESAYAFQSGGRDHQGEMEGGVPWVSHADDIGNDIDDVSGPTKNEGNPARDSNQREQA